MRAELLRDGQIWLSMMEAHEPDSIDPQPLRLGEEELGWIGTGSTGFPTSAGRRAEFLILDDAAAEDWTIEKYAAPYSREEARACAQRILTTVCTQPVADRITRWL